MNLSFQKMFYAIATVFGLFICLVLASPILIPLSIALIMSFILYPMAKKFESWKMNRMLAAFLSITIVILLTGCVIFFFSTQIIELSKEFSNFKDKIILAFSDLTLYINNNVNFVENLEKNELFNRIKDWLSNSTGSLVKKTFNSTTTFLTGLVATIIFTFLILIYRDGLTRAFTAFSPEDKRERVVKMLKSVQQVGQKYLVGMIILTAIIGIANSIGLWAIGIDNPLLFGFLGATMSIIPYIGTSVGAIIPAIYAFVSFDSPWKAVAVIILFWGVQFVSDNFLTPKIVGGSLKINALTALLSLIIGAVVWGLAGMVLFLPFAAMLKVVCEEYVELRPIALLIGTYEYKENDSSGHSFRKVFEKIRSWFPKFPFTFKKRKKQTGK
jgi:predicted PurR-regulated permease PerM